MGKEGSGREDQVAGLLGEQWRDRDWTGGARIEREGDRLDHNVGAIPTVCVFRPLKGTDYEDVPPPDTEAMIPVFRRFYEACMDRNLPIGVAPNIHVSLVLLPEECRWFTDNPRKYALKEMKLKAMSALFTSQFRRRCRKIQAEHRPARAAGAQGEAVKV